MFAWAFVFVFVLTFLGGAPGARADAWKTAGSGRGTFHDLGPAFSVDTPVDNVEGARLVLLNEDLAAEIGLTAESRAALEKKILDTFAVRTWLGKEHSVERTMFATRYLDYPKKELEQLGNPQGDGRNVWAGEVEVETKDGKRRRLDISIKGVGRTPLSRASSFNSQYSDGLQSMDEAVRSYVTSAAVDKNVGEAIRDLAVIEIPTTKNDVINGTSDKAALSVRVGPQTRLGHLEYFADQPDQLRKLLDHSARQMLGLDRDAPIDTDVMKRYLKSLNATLGSTAAIFEDLHFFHGSVTDGNMTTTGQPIDFGTFQMLDANHREFAGPYNAMFLNQTSSFENSGKDFGKLAKRAWPELDIERNWASFSASYMDEQQTRRLKRLGLTSAQASALSTDVRADFRWAVDALSISGKKTIQLLGQSMAPAAFDVDEILSSAIEIADRGPEEKKKWLDVFLTKRSWATLKKSDLTKPLLGYKADSEYRRRMQDFTKAVAKIHAEMKAGGADMKEIATRAKTVFKSERPVSTFPDLSRLLRAVRDKNSTAAANSEIAAGVIERVTHLGAHLGVRTEPFVSRGFALPARHQSWHSDSSCSTGFKGLGER